MGVFQSDTSVFAPGPACHRCIVDSLANSLTRNGRTLDGCRSGAAGNDTSVAEENETSEAGAANDTSVTKSNVCSIEGAFHVAGDGHWLISQFKCDGFIVAVEDRIGDGEGWFVSAGGHSVANKSRMSWGKGKASIDNFGISHFSKGDGLKGTVVNITIRPLESSGGHGANQGRGERVHDSSANFLNVAKVDVDCHTSVGNGHIHDLMR